MLSDKSENYITKEEFNQFIQYNEQRYNSLFNRILGLDMVVRSIILPLSLPRNVENKAKDIIELLDGIKSNLLESGQIAPEHQQDMFFTLNSTVDMLQNILKQVQIQEKEDKNGD